MFALSGASTRGEIPRSYAQRTKRELCRRPTDSSVAILHKETHEAPVYRSVGKRNRRISIKSGVLAESFRLYYLPTTMYAIIASVILVQSAAFVKCLEESERVKLPSKCETCKFVTVELADRFGETGKTHQVIQSAKGRVKKYKDSELRFLETLEGLCDRILSYNMHKEHTNSARFAKGRSETMKTLHGLKEKGVKVDLGIPYDLWDSPSVEVSKMKQYCEDIVSEYEDDLEEWYLGKRKEESTTEMRVSLQKFLCVDRVLKRENKDCLNDDKTNNGLEKESRMKGEKEDL